MAGFIGYHLAKKLSGNKNNTIIGIDNLNDYYSPQLKLDRLKQLGFATDSIPEKKLIKSSSENLFFTKAAIEDKQTIDDLFATQKIDYVVNLAAQAGVRYSLEAPESYIQSNIVGFFTILEACRKYAIKHLVYASSSSVYGLNQIVPYSEKHSVDHPASLYAATKKSNELMAHSYSYLFNIPVTGLRFFSVYGPWGRPDMAYFSFTKKILTNKPIEIYNYGKMKRDFTYIDDIVEGIARLLDKIPVANQNWEEVDRNPDRSVAPYRVYNIGNNKSVPLEDFISILEEVLGKKAERVYSPAHPGDVISTYADIDNLSEITGFTPSTNIRSGLQQFVSWYKQYYKTEVSVG